MALPKNAAHRAACRAAERSKDAKLSAKGAGVGSGGLPQENFSFENALRVGFRLSGVHI